MRIKNIVNVMVFSLSTISSQASEKLENDKFPSWSIAPTLEQIQYASDNREENRSCSLPSITVQNRRFDQTVAGVPLAGPFTFGKSYVDFDGSLNYVYEGTRGSVTYQTKILSEKSIKTWTIFEPFVEEYRKFLEKRLILIRDNILLWSNIFILASGQELWVGGKMTYTKSTLNKKLHDLDDICFINVKLEPLNETEFAKIKSLAHFAVQNNLNLPESFSNPSLIDTGFPSKILKYEINVADISDIFLKRTITS